MDKGKQNVIVVSQYYYPDIATTGQLLSELSAGLATKGLSVQVITAFPTYDSSISSVSEEVYQGVAVRRIWSARFDKNTKFGKIINSLTFFFSALFSILFNKTSGILLIVSNPPFLPFIGYLCNIFQKRKFIYLVHDVYPDIAVRLGYLSKNSITTKLWGIANHFILNSASKIIVLSESMKKIILEKIPDSKNRNLFDKIEIIHNWADGSFIKPIERKENLFLTKYGLQDKFIVLYSGNMGLFHELEMVIEVAKKCDAEEFCFLFIGDGGKRKILEHMVKQYNLENVIFLPYQKKEILPFSLTSGDVSLVTLEENIDGLAMPSKLYSTMAAGNPILAICDEASDVAEIIQNAQCGFSVQHHDVGEMTECLFRLKNDPKLLKEMGENSRSYFDQHYTLDIAVNRYKRIIDFV